MFSIIQSQTSSRRGFADASTFKEAVHHSRALIYLCNELQSVIFWADMFFFIFIDVLTMYVLNKTLQYLRKSASYLLIHV